MLSSIFMSGRLGEVIGEKMRIVEVDRVIPGPSGYYETDRFPVRTMSGSKSIFMRAKVGSYVTLKGRIEGDEKYGVIIIAELDEILLVPEGTVRV